MNEESQSVIRLHIPSQGWESQGTYRTHIPVTPSVQKNFSIKTVVRSKVFGITSSFQSFILFIFKEEIHLFFCWWHYFNLNISYWYLGSVWIGLILLKLKIYYWNHCSKIIFKCVNSTVRPIFNEKVTEKLCLWVCKQCINVLFTVEKSTKPAIEKKKKKKMLKTQT